MSRIEQIKKLMADNPADSFLMHALALEYIKISEDGQAREIFEDLLSKDSNYVGSYYHLAKLYERLGNEQSAIRVYEKGMEVAKQLNDHHAYSELRSAYVDFTY